MPGIYLNPKTLFDGRPYGFTQLVITDARRTIHCSGQTAWNVDTELVGANDLKQQIEQALRNIDLVLTDAGATRGDVARVRIYIVDHKPEYLQTVAECMIAFFGSDRLPASTLIGVSALALPQFLVEIEATAVCDPEAAA